MSIENCRGYPRKRRDGTIRLCFLCCSRRRNMCCCPPQDMCWFFELESIESTESIEQFLAAGEKVEALHLHVFDKFC